MDNLTLDTLLAFFGDNTWIVHIFVIVLATLTVDFAQKRVLDRVYARLRENGNFWDDAFIDALRAPLRAVIWLVGMSYAVAIARTLEENALLAAMPRVRDIGIIIAVTWFLARFIKLGEQSYIQERIARGQMIDRTTTDAVAKLLRLSVIITSALVILQTLGYSISGVLAFGGVGGIAVGFAAKDLLANFFGGLMIYLDRPFSVGDWIRSPDREIEGTVEEIGWRLTKIRTFDLRPLYVPNSLFNNVVVENPSRMRNRRIFETIGIRYDDAGRMAAIVDDVRAMLESHPEIDTNQTLIVNFTSFAASSLNFFVYTFTKTREWVKYHAVKQDVLLKVIEIVEQHGAECAFPTTTLHVASMPPPEPADGEGPPQADAEGPDRGQ
ncbi:MAG: mechanosensitive ion channel family protein [Gammaproteobacteria bacterium]